ncbi:MAG: membrane fusion protein (multidrug efflux system) [Gammaproteobacteria bacterium]|jgi:membrane fusion protein (multidrug efflux system)
MRMLKKILWVLFGIVIVLPVVLGIIGIKSSQFEAMHTSAAQMVYPPETVNSIEVLEVEWQPRISSVGTVVAVQGIVVKNEVEGTVREITFESGTTVNSGDELVRLDYDIERTQLLSAEATADGARIIFNRASELIDSQSISEADFSSVNTGLKEANAQVENIKAIIAKKTIRAPFSGILGIRRISIGEFLDKSSPVVSLQTQNPVYVEFSLPQHRLGELVNGLMVSVTTDSYPGDSFEGEITSVEPNIDIATRNIRVQATMINNESRLRPGMFVSVDMLLARTESKLFIPATAVQHASFGDFVYTIEEGDTNNNLFVERRLVHLGLRQGDYVAVIDGLEAGDNIVSTGVFKLQPGMQVVLDNTLAPTFSFSPTPDNN